MKKFRLVISSPDGNIFDGECERIILRGVCGDLAVMAGHVPFITAVKPCKVKIENDEKEEFIAVDGGLLTVGGEKVTLLTGQAAL